MRWPGGGPKFSPDPHSKNPEQDKRRFEEQRALYKEELRNYLLGKARKKDITYEEAKRRFEEQRVDYEDLGNYLLEKVKKRGYHL
jgi:hypothetical protein